MSPELQAAVEHAYREFACYRLKGAVSVCNCPVCVDAATEKKLHSVPLRDMSSLLLGEYTHSAHGFDDRIADEFRYFLPRYFELIAQDDPPSTIGQEICLVRLHEAGFRRAWPASEVSSIDAFFLALVRARLADPIEIDADGYPTSDADVLETTLCMIAHAGGDLPALLAAWGADRGRDATLRIANIVAKADWRRKRLWNSFWYGMSTRPHIEGEMRRMIEWLIRRETRERLEAACLAEQDAGPAALLSHAEGIVAGMI